MTLPDAPGGASSEGVAARRSQPRAASARTVTTNLIPERNRIMREREKRPRGEIATARALRMYGEGSPGIKSAAPQAPRRLGLHPLAGPLITECFGTAA